ETVLALQDPELHQYLKAKVAERMGFSLVLQMQEGFSSAEIQKTVGSRFIEYTQESLKKYLEEKGRPDVSAEDYTGSSGDGCGNWGDENKSMAEMAACGEIECRQCRWKPRNAKELAQVNRGEITSCPNIVKGKDGKEKPCGWVPGTPVRIQIGLN
ncbi:MAG: hypothetical protein AAB267_03370, partial [Candidatus Desantisbacteria bacterium]